ncbi:MAG: hypothetical protein JWQ11_3873 [Rhizobacter sp.]|nr:hypothetical protein [Rhizobacter sp.]
MWCVQGWSHAQSGIQFSVRKEQAQHGLRQTGYRVFREQQRRVFLLEIYIVDRAIDAIDKRFCE